MLNKKAPTVFLLFYGTSMTAEQIRCLDAVGLCILSGLGNDPVIGVGKMMQVYDQNEEVRFVEIVLVQKQETDKNKVDVVVASIPSSESKQKKST